MLCHSAGVDLAMFDSVETHIWDDVSGGERISPFGGASAWLTVASRSTPARRKNGKKGGRT